MEQKQQEEYPTFQHFNDKFQPKSSLSLQKTSKNWTTHSEKLTNRTLGY